MIGVPVVVVTDAKHVMHSRCVMPDSVTNQVMLDRGADPPADMDLTNLDIKCVTQ